MLCDLEVRTVLRLANLGVLCRVNFLRCAVHACRVRDPVVFHQPSAGSGWECPRPPQALPHLIVHKNRETGLSDLYLQAGKQRLRNIPPKLMVRGPSSKAS